MIPFDPPELALPGDDDDTGGAGRDDQGDDAHHDGDGADDAAAKDRSDDADARRQLRKEKPKRGRLEQDPYAATDFTAYTLEPGEFRIGLFDTSAGVLPRFQVGTYPVPDFFGVLNGDVKWDIDRHGGRDLAILGGFWYVPVGDVINRFGVDPGVAQFLRADVFDVGVRYSVQLLDPWSVHASATLLSGRAYGKFDLRNMILNVFPRADDVLPEDISLVPAIGGEAATVKLATDWRFNRRDSLVLLAGFPVWARAHASVKVDVSSVPQPVDLSVAYGGAPNPAIGVWGSLAYQASFRHWDVRVGVGRAAIPAVWVLPTFDLAYHFGGKTRAEEGQMRKDWRERKRDLNHGD